MSFSEARDSWSEQLLDYWKSPSNKYDAVASISEIVTTEQSYIKNLNALLNAFEANLNLLNPQERHFYEENIRILKSLSQHNPILSPSVLTTYENLNKARNNWQDLQARAMKIEKYNNDVANLRQKTQAEQRPEEKQKLADKLKSLYLNKPKPLTPQETIDLEKANTNMNVPLKQLYASLTSAYTSEEFKQYQEQSKLFIQRYTAFIALAGTNEEFKKAVLANVNAALKSAAVMTDTNTALKTSDITDTTTIGIQVTQRIARHVLLLQQVIKATGRDAVDIPEKNVVSLLHKSLDTAATEANTVSAVSPYQNTTLTLISDAVDSVIYQSTHQKNTRLDLPVLKAQELKKLFLQSEIRDPAAVITLISSKVNQSKTQAVDVTQLSPHQQMLFQTISLLEKERDPTKVEQLTAAKSTLSQLISKEMTYEAYINGAVIYNELGKLHKTEATNATQFANRIRDERIQVSRDMTGLNSQLQAHLQNIPELMQINIAMSDPSPLRTPGLTLGGNDADFLMTQVPERPYANTNQESRKETIVSVNVVEPKLEGFKQQIKHTAQERVANALNHVTKDYYASELHMVDEKLQASTQSASELSDSIVNGGNLRAILIERTNQSLQLLSTRPGDTGAIARVWVHSSASEADLNRLAESLSLLDAYQLRQDDITHSETELHKHEKDIAQTANSLRVLAEQTDLPADIKEEMLKKVAEFEQSQTALVANLKEKIADQRQSFASLVTREMKTISELESKLQMQRQQGKENTLVADLRKEFANLPTLSAASERPLVREQSLEVLTQGKDYVALVARKWTKNSDNGLTPHKAHIERALNKIRNTQAQVAHLDQRLLEIQTYFSLQQSIQHHEKNSGLASDSKAALKELKQNMVEQTNLKELKSLYDALLKEKQNLQSGMRRDYVRLNELDAGMESIIIRNAVKNGGTSQEQINGFTAALKQIISDLDDKLKYQLSGPSGKGNSLPQDKEYEIQLALKVIHSVKSKLDTNVTLQSLHELKAELGAVNNPHIKQLLTSFESGYDKLKSNSALTLRHIDKQILQVKYIKPSEHSQSPTVNLSNKLTSVQALVHAMQTLLEQRLTFVKDKEHTQTQQLLNQYNEIAKRLDSLQQQRNGITSPQGSVFGFSRDMVQSLESLVKAPVMNVNPEVKSALKTIQQELKAEIKYRDPSAQQNRKLGLFERKETSRTNRETEPAHERANVKKP